MVTELIVLFQCCHYPYCSVSSLTNARGGLFEVPHTHTHRQKQCLTHTCLHERAGPSTSFFWLLDSSYCSPIKLFCHKFIINPLLAKLVQPRCPDVSLVFVVVLFFCVCIDLNRNQINATKKNSANIIPPWPHHRLGQSHIYLKPAFDKLQIPSCTLFSKSS